MLQSIIKVTQQGAAPDRGQSLLYLEFLCFYCCCSQCRSGCRHRCSLVLRPCIRLRRLCLRLPSQREVQTFLAATAQRPIHVCNTHTHTPMFHGTLSRTTQVSQYQKGKTNLDFTEARDNEWQWHQLDHMQVCTSLQTDNHASTPPLSFLQAGCPFCRPTNSIKALKAYVCVIVIVLRCCWLGGRKGIRPVKN